MLDDPEARVVGHRFSPASHDARDFLARNRVPYEWLDARPRPGGAPPPRPRRDLQRPAAGGVPARRRRCWRRRRRSSWPTRLGLPTHAELDFYDLIIVGGGPGRARRRGLRRLRGPAHRAGRARGARRPGRPELADRELPRLPERALGRRPRAPRARPGAPLRRRAAARPGGRPALEARGPQRVVTLAGRRASSPATACWSRPASPTAGSTRPAWPSSRAAASTTAPRSSRPRLRATRPSSSSAAPTPPARPRSSWRARPARVLAARARRRRSTKSMSHYLIEQIDAIDEHRGPHGDAGRRGRGRRAPRARSALPARTARRRSTPRAMFVFIGAAPYTDWVGEPRRPRRARLRPRRPGRARPRRARRWPLERDPFLLETTLPGVFVAGDVRHRSIKRVASAVGEGSMSVQFIHQYLADT